MLQQTTVVTVMPYYERFLKRYPAVQDLALAPIQEVLAAWAGLGYYSRARNLHACAQKVVELGGFPSDVEGLRALPGIGAYTARAVAAIAFGRPVVPVDGNVERVTARLHAVTEPLPGARRKLDMLASLLNDDPAARAAPSDFAQALFDLGAGLCTPRRPSCLMCPWRESCKGHAEGTPELYPVRAPRKVKPERYGVVFLITDAQGAIWLRQRPDKGLLGGMTELPGTTWRDEVFAPVEALREAPVSAAWTDAGEIQHVFTHFRLHLRVMVARLSKLDALHNQSGFACPPEKLDRQALPTVMKKCLTLAGQARVD